MQAVFRKLVGVLLFSGVFVACTPIDTASVVEVQILSEPTREIIYVTPTREPTAIPTFASVTQTPAPTETPMPTSTPDVSQQQAACRATLDQLFTTATELCVGEPGGFFCNGGAAPLAEPTGPINSAMGVRGSLVEVGIVEAVQTAPLLSGNAGGVVWLRAQGEQNWSSLLLGDVEVRDVTPRDGNFPAWQSFTVRTNQHSTGCAAAPPSTFVVQGSYGVPSRVVINGVSIDLNGTIAVHTEPLETHFIALEGLSRLTVIGQTFSIFAGQQVRVPYPENNYARPSGAPAAAEPLEYSDIENLPITLLDRPVLLPQPGFVRAQGNVNIRAEANVNARQLFQVPDGEPMSVLGQNTERSWYHIRVGNGETGWVRSDLVQSDLGQINAFYDEDPALPQRYGQNSTSAVVTALDGGNLRSAPHVSFPILTTLPEGTQVNLIARSPYSPWVKVDTGSAVGWMALITIETDAIISFLPQDYEAPLPPIATATPFLAFGGGHAYPDPRGGS